MKTIKLLVLLLVSAIAVHAQAVWDGTTADSYAGGDGSQASPYLISTPQQLAKLAQDVANIEGFSNGKYFKLTADIVMNTGVYDAVKPATRQDYEDLPTNSDISKFRLTPRIGNYESDDNYTAFQGTFDGDGHVISGLIDQLYSGKTFDGLFRVVENGTIKNLGISDSYALANAFTGGIVGRLINSRMVNCYVEKSYIEQGGSYGGALIGQCIGQSYVLNCYADCTVFGKNNMGGLIGRIGNGQSNPCVVDNCFSYVNIRVKKRNNGAISCECCPASSVRHCYYIKLGETRGAIYEEAVNGEVTDTEELTAEQFAAEQLISLLNNRATTLPGAARWTKGSLHPVPDYSEFSADDLPISAITPVLSSFQNTVRVFNLSGTAVHHPTVHGLYIIQTTDAAGHITVRKIVK